MIDVILDAVYDSIKAFFVIFVVYIILSFVEIKIANKLKKGSKLSPLYGAVVGLIPQCGISVVGADLYSKKHISVGTLMAIFIACSDEAIPLILGGGISKAIAVFPLLLFKLIIGFSVGVIVDLVISNKDVAQHMESCKHHDIETHTGCCHHHIDEDDGRFETHIYHPFIHSLKLFAYVLGINVVLGLIVYFIGEDTLSSFLENSKYLSVFYAVIVGLIPNCSSSVILAELFINNSLSFGATLAGLCVNAGLGMVFLFKDKSNIKRNVLILISLISISLIVGYLVCLLNGF